MGCVLVSHFSCTALTTGHEAWCYLFCHCALKMPNESVVESMGKTVADHADAKRGCKIETYTNEAVVHWNAPPIALARAFCIKVLKQHFGDNWRSAFVHTSDRDRHGAANGARKRKAFVESEVVERIRKQKPKLDFMAA